MCQHHNIFSCLSINLYLITPHTELPKLTPIHVSARNLVCCINSHTVCYQPNTTSPLRGAVQQQPHHVIEGVALLRILSSLDRRKWRGGGGVTSDVTCVVCTRQPCWICNADRTQIVYLLDFHCLSDNVSISDVVFIVYKNSRHQQALGWLKLKLRFCSKTRKKIFIYSILL